MYNNISNFGVHEIIGTSVRISRETRFAREQMLKEQRNIKRKKYLIHGFH